ncbi:SpoIIE family protein phosphatase [Streptomyces sp. DSM 44917]|uniref:SpoIIE family protein phosphatase n=1 Tax=Streptomyces boetiae TaxID=3075541 RepID=A0ABU2L7H7_9ACTN|nr:SpoIIE family protein phosphatase [Streptomyces sp. DSM 44917]MDT0307519.1 SpoIIE family protein phosphatase [Streptomyces sp. DSM 44917]
MDARHDGSTEERLGPTPARRLRFLAAVDDSQEDTGVLTAGLQQATAELGGLGGMAHLRAGGTSRTLYVVASTGLPRGFTRPWESIRADGQAPPARAMREGRTVWSPTVAAPDQERGDASAVPQPAALSAGLGLVAVPLRGPGGSVGALSVLIPSPGPSGGGPDAAGLAFLGEVARWAAGRLRLTSPSPENLSPALLQALQTGPDLRQALKDVAAEPFEWDLRTGELTFPDTMRALLSDLDPAALDGRMENWVDAIHPDDKPWVVTEVDRAIRAGGAYDVEHRTRWADGTYGWVRIRGRALTDDAGHPVRVVGTVWNTTETHAALESAGRALRHMSDGFLAVGGDWRTEFANGTAESLLGSPPGLVGKPLWDVPAVRAVPGLEERAREAAARGTPGGFDVRWPDSDRWYHLRLVPVPDGLTLYITDITERRLREAAQRAAADRAALVARLTRHLAEAVTAQDVVTAVADSVLPPFGAAGLVVFAAENDRLNVVGSVGYPRALLSRVHGRPIAADTPVGEALRTRTPQFVESADAFAARYPGMASGTDERAEPGGPGGKSAWAFLPLTVSGRGIGAAVVSFDHPRRFDGDERTLLTALSGLIAQALERAGLYDAAATRARELQRALLPRELPALPAATSAARYLPAGPGTEVGGDWYDVIPLSADRVALVIGDVMGHGMAQAATMGRLRTAVRTLSDLELPPDDILARLNDIVGDLGEDYFATCLYGIYDPVTGHFGYASAGHPPPATVRPDGAVTYPSLIPDPPLGVAAPPFDTVDVRLADDALLVLYTDGLVEHPGRDIDQGMARLARVLRGGPSEDLDALCDAVTGALLPAGRQAADDAALLITRVRELAPEDVATWPLPDDPVAAGQARGHIRAQLAAWDLEDLEMTTELLASELVGNVIRHAKGPVHLRLLRSRTLICEVSDGSLTTPHIRHAAATDESGRGLQLVAAVAHRWGTRHTPAGKTIWTEQPIPR